jgi:molybdopterin converting factor small subunit
MLVEVRLFATFREGRFNKKQLDVCDGYLLCDLLKQLDIPLNRVGILLVNGRNTSSQYKLIENDVISIFPAIAGG